MRRLHRASRRPALGPLLTTGGLMAVMAGAARAQPAPPTAPPASPAPTVSDVVVTARRRAERLQDVPVPISAISSAALARIGDNQVQSLQYLAPSANISIANPRQTNFAIRGVGNNPATDGLSSSVGLYLDGVYLDRPGMADFNLLDVERVEVLRGPQGTLFGRNTTAGALNISTRAPSSAFEATGVAEFGDYDLTNLQASVSGPLTEGLSARLSAYKEDRSGYLNGLAHGVAHDSLHRQGLRAQLLWKPTPAFQLRLIGEYGSEDDSGGALVLYSKGPATSANPRFIPFDTWAARNGVKPLLNPYGLVDDLNGAQRLKQSERALTAVADYRLGGGYTLSSIAGYRFWTFTPSNDFDWGPASAFTTNGVIDREKQYSEELRLTSPTGGVLDYVAGLYVFHRDLSAVQRTVYGPAYSLGLGPAGNAALNGATSLTSGTPNTTSYAVFGQGTIHFDSRLSLTLGLRETYERNTESIQRQALTGGTGTPPSTVAPYDGRLSLENTEPSGLIDLGYHVTPDVLLYGSAAYSAKAGGFNAPAVPQSTSGAIQPASTLLVKPERALDYELGAKTAWLRRRLTLNLALYWTELFDYQANTLQAQPNGAVLNLITNVGGVVSRGVEAESTFSVSRDLSLQAALGFNDARYRHFSGAPAVQGALAGVQNLSGRPVAAAPRWTADIGATYTHALAATVQGHLDILVAYHSAEYGYVDDSAYSRLPGYVLGDLRAGARFQGGRYDVSLWVRNVGDARYFYSVTPAITGSAGYFASVAEPRTFGATLKASF